jgi:HSP20 family molecular chaperone IbpA
MRSCLLFKPYKHKRAASEELFAPLKSLLLDDDDDHNIDLFTNGADLFNIRYGNKQLMDRFNSHLRPLTLELMDDDRVYDTIDDPELLIISSSDSDEEEMKKRETRKMESAATAAKKNKKVYQVSLDCSEFRPESIKAEIRDGKLIVSGSEGQKQQLNDDDYSIKEFRKSHQLPPSDQLDLEKMSSRMNENGQFIVEIPYKQKSEAAIMTKKSLSPSTTTVTTASRATAAFPTIVENEKGEKSVLVQMKLPTTTDQIDPTRINVICKDRDVIVRMDNACETESTFSKFYFYQRITLPEKTDLKALKCFYENDQLKITAPLLKQQLHLI